VASKAADLQLPVPDVLDNADLLALLCTPGFTTREQADFGSGRGVGMDIVNTTLRELGGSLEMTTEAGAGTTFTLRVPLTLSVTDVIVVAAYPQICAVPQAAVQELIQAPSVSVRTVKRTEVVPYRDGVLPLVRLGGLFGLEPSTQESLTIAVLITERGEVGLVVDRVLSQREVVVRPMPDPLVRARGIAGATELGDGKPVLILDAAALTAGVVRPSARLRQTVAAT
jgi:two-component system chemotaxis sensor kinase CheA